MYIAKNYSKLLGMKGFSDELLETHFKLYEGYVAATNDLLKELAEARKSRNGTPRVSPDIRRRLGWEWNGMRLHEYYFENLGGRGSLDPDGRFARKLARDFGTASAWEEDFRATAAMRGIGWVCLYQDRLSGLLLNVWINEHDVGHIVGGLPLLVLDAFEHAYLGDYGLRKVEYVDAFLNNVDWKVVESRLTQPAP